MAGRLGGISVLEGSLAGRSFELPPMNDEILIGRGSKCAIRFDASLDRCISTIHAAIEHRMTGGYQSQYVLVDKSSRNGSWIRGMAVDPDSGGIVLKDGDEFRLGGQEGLLLRFEAPQGMESTQVLAGASLEPTLLTEGREKGRALERPLPRDNDSTRLLFSPPPGQNVRLEPEIRPLDPSPSRPQTPTHASLRTVTTVAEGNGNTALSSQTKPPQAASLSSQQQSCKGVTEDSDPLLRNGPEGVNTGPLEKSLPSQPQISGKSGSRLEVNLIRTWGVAVGVLLFAAVIGVGSAFFGG